MRRLKLVRGRKVGDQRSVPRVNQYRAGACGRRRVDEVVRFHPVFFGARRELATEVVGADGAEETSHPRVLEHPLRHPNAVLSRAACDVLYLEI